MSDLISRQAALDAMNELPYGYRGIVWDILNGLPSAEPERWRVISKRPMDEDERKEWSEKIGYDIDYEDANIYMGLPDDGEEVLICTRWGSVTIDIFRDEDGCYFDDHDMEDVVAWCELPEPYKGGTE